MCGRAYSTYTPDELYFQYLNRRPSLGDFSDDRPQFKPNYNFCPTQTSVILCQSDDLFVFKQMRWGLVPAWAKTVKDADKYSMINAKSEGISEKKSYRAAFQKRRCIVPVSGFYEWKTAAKIKTPFAISLKSDQIMNMAGIWEHWQSSESGEAVDSFSIVTTAANSFMTNIHARMPVILSAEQEGAWINLNTEREELNLIMKGCSSEELLAKEVSKLVNSPKNNSPEVLEGAHG